MIDYIRFESDFEVACKEMIKAVDSGEEYKEGVLYVKELFPLNLFKSAKDPSKYTLKLFKDSEDFFLDISDFVDQERRGVYIVVRFEDLTVHPMALKLFKAVCHMLVNGLKCSVVLVNSKTNLERLFTLFCF